MRRDACSLCKGPLMRVEVDAGGDVGTVHLACFLAWDAQQEALECEHGGCYNAPEPEEVRDAA